MKKYILMFIAVLAVVAVAMPASAFEVTYGGLFRSRIFSQSDFPAYSTQNLEDGVVPVTDHLNRIDQRLRIFMYFVASENLRVVTKFEANTIWGDVGSHIRNNGSGYNSYGGGEPGADVNNFIVKNSYVEFNIPSTPVKAMVGVQGIALLDSWIIDDDFSAAVTVTKLPPFTVSVGYVSGQNYITTDENENIDDVFISVDYKSGPFSGSLIGFYQYAHDTTASVFPMALQSPPQFTPAPFTSRNPFDTDDTIGARDNNLFDLGAKLAYKIDYLSAYVEGVKNFGSVKLQEVLPEVEDEFTADYKGWMIDAGVNYFCAPYTLNVGGFYTSGAKLDVDDEGDIVLDTSDLDWFTYPLTTSKYFSEIMGGGILDNTAPNGGYWRGYPYPFNIWTVTAGAAWQIQKGTKLSASYWYFGTSEDVPSKQYHDGSWDFDNSLGHEFDVYLTQNIVDGLNLDLVGAYMITEDAFKITHEGFDDKNDDTYEVGARIQWAF